MRYALAFVAASVLLSGADRLEAAPILDQQYLVSPLGAFAVIEGTNTDFRVEEAQTFTAGLSGLLHSVEIQVARNSASTIDDLLLDIRGTSGGAPLESDGSALASVAIPASSVPIGSSSAAFISVDVSSFGIFVSPGDELAIVLQTLSPFGYAWPVKTFGSPLYPGGARYVRGPLIGLPTWTFQATHDQAFRTFVDTEILPAVPEPSSFGLLATGVLALSVYRRRQKRPFAARVEHR